MDLGTSWVTNDAEITGAKSFNAKSAGKKKLEGIICVGVHNIKLDLRERCIEFWHNSPTIRGEVQNILDWCSHLYNSYDNAKYRSQQAKMWFPGCNVKFCGDCVKTCEYITPEHSRDQTWLLHHDIASFILPSSPGMSWINTNGCHPTPTVIPWFGNLWLLPVSKNGIGAERTSV
jgi:hypothetical protein